MLILAEAVAVAVVEKVAVTGEVMEKAAVMGAVEEMEFSVVAKQMAFIVILRTITSSSGVRKAIPFTSSMPKVGAEL